MLSYKKQINNLSAVYNVYVYTWGLRVMVHGTVDGQRIGTVERRFNRCPSSPTIADTMRRMKRYYNLDDSNLVCVVK